LISSLAISNRFLISSSGMPPRFLILFLKILSFSGKRKIDKWGIFALSKLCFPFTSI
jgi:hypothetical protein